MNTITLPNKAQVRLHIKPAVYSFLFAALITAFIVYDRRPPFEYISSEITPSLVKAGQSIIINRNVNWFRKCEGEAWTEIVSSDRIVTPYDKGYRYPSEIGITFTQRSLDLPLIMRPGTSYYRGTIRFHTCGLTSRLKAIDIPYQERSFEVR